jgi:hypothetical protein
MLRHAHIMSAQHTTITWWILQSGSNEISIYTLSRSLQAAAAVASFKT